MLWKEKNLALIWGTVVLTAEIRSAWGQPATDLESKKSGCGYSGLLILDCYFCCQVGTNIKFKGRALAPQEEVLGICDT